MNNNKHQRERDNQPARDNLRPSLRFLLVKARKETIKGGLENWLDIISAHAVHSGRSRNTTGSFPSFSLIVDCAKDLAVSQTFAQPTHAHTVLSLQYRTACLPACVYTHTHTHTHTHTSRPGAVAAPSTQTWRPLLLATDRATLCAAMT